jgi:hypothetical protein
MAQFKGTQNIYAADGEILFDGQWDSKELFKAVTGSVGKEYWRNRTILDIGANSSGLSLELARAGADVLAIEPDPYNTIKKHSADILNDLIAAERLDLSFGSDGLFDAHKLGNFDTILCLGLVYHFRDQQFVLDYLSTCDASELIISNQTAPGNQLSMVNRLDESVRVPDNFWSNYKERLSGWHPTRPLFERMLDYAGFTNVECITDNEFNYPQKPSPGVTNSAYYRAQKGKSIDPVASRYVYLPR